MEVCGWLLKKGAVKLHKKTIWVNLINELIKVLDAYN